MEKNVVSCMTMTIWTMAREWSVLKLAYDVVSPQTMAPYCHLPLLHILNKTSYVKKWTQEPAFLHYYSF
jgi:hypothetical protein